MVYSAAEIFPVTLIAIDVADGMLLIMDVETDIDIMPAVEDWAATTATRSWRASSFSCFGMILDVWI